MEYYARSPLEVFAVDENMERLTGSIPYTSLIWHRRYTGVGEFRMDVLSDVYDPSWAFIVCSDRPETGIVQKVEYSDTALTPDGKDTVTVSGFFLEQLLYDVTFLVEETGEKVIEISAPRNSNRGYTSNQEPLEVYWSTVNEEYVYRDPESGQIKDNDGNTVAFGGLEKVDYEWNGKVHKDSIEMPDGSKVDGYWQDRSGYYTPDDGETIVRVPYAAASGEGDNDKTFDVELKVGGKYFYKRNTGTLVMVNGVAEKRENTYWVRYRKWLHGPRTKTIQVKGPWQRTDIGEPEEEGDSVELVIKWVRKFFTNEWQFEEPEFEGETMVLDLSLKYLGDVVYDTLGRIEAAPRVQYDFESDTTVFSVYRGNDLTQEAMQAGTVDQTAAIAPMSAKASAFNASSLTQGYTVLSYIQSTGTQYIDTGFKPNQDTRVVAKMGNYDVNTDQWYFGSRDGTNVNAFGFMSTGDRFRSDYGTNTVAFDAGPGDLEIDKNKNELYISGDLKVSHPAATFQGANSMYIFGMHQGGSKDSLAIDSIKFYYFDIYDDGVKVRGFVPAKRSDDGAVGMYDTVSGAFYANAGTGAFIAGPEVMIPASLQYLPNSATATGETPATAGYAGDYVSVAQCGFVRSDATFTTWNTSADGNGSDYAPGSQYLLTNGSDVLYAQWEESEEPEPEGGKAPYAVFNDTWGSMYGYSASADESAYKNTSYVLYEYDVPDSFDENGYPTVKAVTSIDSAGYLVTTGWEIPYHTERGYYEVTVGDEGERRRETFLDMRDSDPSCDGEWPRDVTDLENPVRGMLQFDPVELGLPKCKDTYEGYPQSLKDAGTTDLKTNHGRVYNLGTGTLNTDGYIRDYDLGDKVDWGVYSLGIQRTGRIVGVEEVYESGNIRINLTIGDELVSLMDKARRN